MNLGDEPGQISDDNAEEQVEEANPEMDASEDDTPVAESDDSDEADIDADSIEEEPADLYEVTLPGGEKAEVTLDELSKG